MLIKFNDDNLGKLIISNVVKIKTRKKKEKKKEKEKSIVYSWPLFRDEGAPTLPPRGQEWGAGKAVRARRGEARQGGAGRGEKKKEKRKKIDVGISKKKKKERKNNKKKK